MSTARPSEIEPLSNRFLIHPVAHALLPLAIRLRLRPNQVTATGLALGVLAGVAYSRWHDWRWATLGLLLMIGWHVMDGLDGMLARSTGQTSDLGRLLDGVADYTAFVAVYVALAIAAPDPQVAIVAAIVSGACHALQALFYEGERVTYIRRMAGNFAAARRSQVGGIVEALYNRGEALLGNRTRPFDLELQAADPARRAQLLARWQQKSRRVFRVMALLSANGRTLAIWIAVLLADPMLFWLWEMVPLTLLAIWSAFALRRAEIPDAGATAPPAPHSRGAMDGHA